MSGMRAVARLSSRRPSPTFADPDGFRVVLAAAEWNADDELTDRLADTGLRRYRELLRRLGD
jgi:hypothetical protein